MVAATCIPSGRSNWPPFPKSGAPALSHDGSQVAFVRFDRHGIALQTYVMNIDGTDAHAVTAPALEAGLPDFAPDGRLTVTSRVTTTGAVSTST
jgi:Tol biopolymer transport system component